MANLNKVVYLSEAQKETLFTNGSITVNGQTITFSNNDLYVTPSAIDIAPAQNSDNLITSGAVYTALNNNIADVNTIISNTINISNTEPTNPDNKLWINTNENATITTEIPTVAEMDTADALRTKTNEIGIVITGARPSMIVTVGQYVIVRNSTINGITDGLYTTVNALSPNTDVIAADLTAVSGGGLNNVPKWLFALSTVVRGVTISANGYADVLLTDIDLPSNFSFIANGNFGEGCILRNSWIENGKIKITIGNYSSSSQTLPNWATVKVLYQAI